MLNPKKLFLLKREISPYSGEDLFLGVYDNLELADRQRGRYIQNCKIQDKWKNQAYKEVDLENDLEIIEIQKEHLEDRFPQEGQRVYFVSGMFEAFGQITKKLVSISVDKSEVEKFMQMKDEEDHIEDDEFAYYKFEELKLNVLYFQGF